MKSSSRKSILHHTDGDNDDAHAATDNNRRSRFQNKEDATAAPNTTTTNTTTAPAPKKERRKKQVSIIVADFMGMAEDADLKWEINAMQTSKIKRPNWHGPSMHALHGGPSLHGMQESLDPLGSDSNNNNNKNNNNKDSPFNTNNTTNTTTPRGTAFHGDFSSKFTDFDKQRVMASLRRNNNKNSIVFLPWSKAYKAWWFLTVIGAITSFFFETYCIAFLPAGLPYSSSPAIIEYCLVALFLADIFVNLNLAYYDEEEGVVVYERRSIRKNYFKFIFWIDLIGIFPFYLISLAIAGQIGQDNSLTQYLALFRLSRLVRTYRIKRLFRMLQYNSRVSFVWLTLIRNFVLAFMWSHVAACIIYFISRQFKFSDHTLLGSKLNVSLLSTFDRYVVSMYWSIVTFATVGYGDFSATNNQYEQIFTIIYILLNIIIQAWMIGSITLIIVKGDGKTGVFRDTLKVLHQYCKLNAFDTGFEKSLRTQLKLEFDNREIADEQVLKHFPSSVRSKVLRQLYLPFLIRTNLMKGVRQQFVDSFLAACKVEIFSAGEQIVQRGSIAADLYLLVGGTVKAMPWESTTTEKAKQQRMGQDGTVDDHSTQSAERTMSHEMYIEAGEFINEIGFLTESPQLETVRTVTVCKLLTMSRSAYKAIAEAHPGSISKILNNLLEKVHDLAFQMDSMSDLNVSKPVDALYDNNEAMWDDGQDPSYQKEVMQSVAVVQTQTSLAAVQDMVTMHITKLQDDHTTRFLYAASREDLATISLMCEHGFDPNTCDYDGRTALMVASMRGNVLAVRKLLECNANPNLTDLHGSTALSEATRCGHVKTMEELLKARAHVGMDESKAAWTLCQAVFDGDVILLRRLLQAGIDANASDYDKRSPAHIAAAEGNVAAMKILVEFGADLTLEDRWRDTIDDEARRSRSGPMLSFLETLARQKSGFTTNPSNIDGKTPTFTLNTSNASIETNDWTEQNGGTGEDEGEREDGGESNIAQNRPEQMQVFVANESEKVQRPTDADRPSNDDVEYGTSDRSNEDHDEHVRPDYENVLQEEEETQRINATLQATKWSLDQALLLYDGLQPASFRSASRPNTEQMERDELWQKLYKSLRQASIDLVSYQSKLSPRRLELLKIIRGSAENRGSLGHATAGFSPVTDRF